VELGGGVVEVAGLLGKWLGWLVERLALRALRRRFERVKRVQHEIGMARIYMFDPFGVDERVELLFTLAHTSIDYFDHVLIYRVRRLLTS
jgi:hypothetical protein